MPDGSVPQSQSETPSPSEEAAPPPPEELEVSTRVRVAFVVAVIVFGVLPAIVMWYLLSKSGGFDTLLDELGRQLSAIGHRL
jgi:hypothetical protein